MLTIEELLSRIETLQKQIEEKDARIAELETRLTNLLEEQRWDSISYMEEMEARYRYDSLT